MTNLAAVAPLGDLIDVRPVSLFTEDSHSEAVEISHPVIALHDFLYGDSQFRVSLLKGGRLTPKAASLLERAYTDLGYIFHNPAHEAGSSASLQATMLGRVVGTLSVTLDSARGIQAETLYRLEIAHYRQRGRICEFTRLAADTEIRGREILCSLFYMAYVYAHLVNGATDLFVEVNPRHASFYKKMLGFEQLGEAKLCPRVNAPAVLLHLDFRHTGLQINRARLGLSVDTSKLYQHAATEGAERELVQSINCGLSRNAYAGK